MKPRTKLQIRIFDLSQRMLPMSKNQEKWSFANALEHIAYRTKSNTSCLDCGHIWKSGPCVKVIKCPSCNVKLTMKDSKKKKFDQSAVVAIVDVVDELQVIRAFEIKSYHKAGEKPRQYIREVSQQWFTPNGKLTVVGRTVSGYWGGYAGEMEIRPNISTYYVNNKYDLFVDKILPGARCLDIYQRNGFTDKVTGVCLYELFKSILSDNKCETLLKAGQYGLLSARMGNKSYDVSRFWDSIKICIRQNYKVNDAGMWLDYLDLQQFFGKDLRNYKYVCPQNVKDLHDRLVVKKRAVERKRSIEKQRKELISAQAAYERHKGNFFGLMITDGDLSIKFIETVQEFMEEGDIHHHCVFTNRYYEKPNSLVFSAQVAGKRVETVELSLELMKVVQSRGMQNAASEYNQRIVDLMNKNIGLISKRIRGVRKEVA